MAARKSTGWLILIVLLTISCGSLSLEAPTPGAETLQMDGVTQIVAPPTDLGMGRLFWSPDGTQLVFSYARTEVDDLLSPPSKYQILTTDIQGGELRVIEASDESRDVLAWPVNDRIALFASVDLQEGIWLMPSTGGEPKEFLFNALQAIWSWDGEQIAYQRFQRGPQTNRLSIVVHSSNNNEERQVFTTERKGNPLTLLQWSPDGGSLLFGIDDGVVAGNDIYLLNLETDETMRLTQGGYHGSASWSTDGALIVYTYRKDLSPAEQNTLYVMRSDGSCPTGLLPRNDQDVGWAMWSPDGRWIAFTWNRGIYLLDTLEVEAIDVLKNGSTCPVL